jgi:hypothetical protein
METTHTDEIPSESVRDAGATTVEYLGWAAMSTVAIVAIGTALQVLGLDLIDYVRTQLGI